MFLPEHNVDLYHWIKFQSGHHWIRNKTLKIPTALFQDSPKYRNNKKYKQTSSLLQV